MKTWTRLTMLALALPVLASCALLANRRDEFVVYALRPASAPARDTTAVPRAWQLALVEPEAIAPLDGARIVVMPKPSEIQFYRGARWRADVPTMLQTLLRQALESRVNVSAPGNGMRADFTLRTSLRDFQAEYRDGDHAPAVVVALTAQLISTVDGRVVAGRTFTMDQPAMGTSVAEIIMAFESATNRLCTELAAWSLASGDAGWVTRNRQ